MATYASFPLRARQTTAPGGNNGKSASASGLVSTLIPALLIAIAVFTAFLLLRNRFSRVYKTRTHDEILLKHELSENTSAGFFGLIKNFSLFPDEYVMEHNSLDGYLFLRFFKLLIMISFGGCCITWPILFPVNATGGGGQKQLNVVSMSNIANPNRYYAHTLVAWIYLGAVFLLVLRERILFIALRQAFFLSTFQARRLSSRTVLFMSIPKESATEAGVRELFGPHVRKVWLAKDCDKLSDLVADYDKAFNKLEAGQVRLSKDANEQRLKKAAGKKAKEQTDVTDPADPRHWIDPKARPTHRLKFLIGKKVDTINWCLDELPKMKMETEQRAASTLASNDLNQTSAFVEFDSQLAAQHAFQSAGKSAKKQFQPRYIGVTPNEVIWKNLKTTYSSRKTKIFIFTVLVSFVIIFFTPISAFVGALGNINSLTQKVPFLGFINKVPSVILGVITGLLPSILLAVLVALVPIIMRLLAKLAGEPTLVAVELKTQGWYMAFQVIQVFLVTTFASGAAAVASQIVQDPTSAPALLANNLPKASNFYISYFIIYGLGQASMLLLNIAPLAMIYILGKFLDKTPRKQYNRWLGMLGLGWGSEYPKWTNLGVIALSYSCIAPLILGFATIGFLLLYVAFRYKWLFILGNKIDMRGESYVKALSQLLVGVYLSAICLIGLFGIGAAENAAGAGPLVLMIIFLVALVIAHVLSEIALAPLEKGIPLDMFEDEHLAVKSDPQDHEQGNAMAGTDYIQGDNKTERSLDSGTEVPEKSRVSPIDKSDSTMTKKGLGGMLTRMIRKYVAKQYPTQKQRISSWPVALEAIPDYSREDYEIAYKNPALVPRKRIVWLARDECGVSKMSKEQNEKVGIETSDELAWFNQKNKVEWAVDKVEQTPIWEPITRY